MAYEKRMCILKQLKRGFTADGGILTGVVHAERTGRKTQIIPRVLGLVPVKEGTYALAVKIGEKTFVSDYQKEITIEETPSLKDGFCVLLCYVKGDAEGIAFGRCGQDQTEYKTLLSLFEKGEEKQKKVNTLCKKEEKKGNIYDDEAISDVNFYERERAVEDENASSNQEEKGGEKEGERILDEDETNAFSLQRKTLSYFCENREKIEECLKKYPPDHRLKKVFPYSEWVNKEETLFGVIYERGEPCFVCVAIEKGKNIPAEMQEEGVFVPTDYFEEEKGFYVIFKSAHTGETVKMKNS